MSSSGTMDDRLHNLAEEVAKTLALLEKKCVLAESCTGGKIAAALTTVPGISASFCGSSVTYREATKTQWLGISETDLRKHTAESEATTIKMAKQIIARTPEADFAVAITGHLGPGVDEEIDGTIFTVAAKRLDSSFGFISNEHQLTGSDRRERQSEAACLALEDFLYAISDNESQPQW